MPPKLKVGSRLDRMTLDYLRDRERILCALVEDMRTGLMHGRALSRDDEFPIFDYGNPPPQIGEMVQTTVMHHYWKLGWFLGDLGDDRFLIREIGGPHTIECYNASYHVIKHRTWNTTYLEAYEYDYARKVLSAMAGDEYWHRFAGFKWHGEFGYRSRRECTVTIRHRMTHPQEFMEIKLGPWTPKTSVKSIRAELLAGGYTDESKYAIRFEEVVASLKREVNFWTQHTRALMDPNPVVAVEMSQATLAAIPNDPQAKATLMNSPLTSSPPLWGLPVIINDKLRFGVYEPRRKNQ